MLEAYNRRIRTALSGFPFERHSNPDLLAEIDIFHFFVVKVKVIVEFEVISIGQFIFTTFKYLYLNGDCIVQSSVGPMSVLLPVCHYIVYVYVC